MSARTTVKSIQDLMRQDVGVDGDAQRAAVSEYTTAGDKECFVG